MMLREELRRRLLEERGIYVTEACDACGQLLGSVRYTRRGEPVDQRESLWRNTSRLEVRLSQGR